MGLPLPHTGPFTGLPSHRLEPNPSRLNVHAAHARQIRGVKTNNSLSEPRQFQTEKNLGRFEFGQLFLARRDA